MLPEDTPKLVKAELIPFDPKTRRVMHRSQIKGDERIA